MRLVVVAMDYPPARGGIQTYAWELTRRWARAGHALSVIAPHHAEAARFDAESRVPTRRVAGSDAFFLTAAAELRRLPAGTTTFHTSWPSAAGAELLRAAGRLGRVFIAAHGRELLLRPLKPEPLQRIYDRARSATLRSADGVFPVSRFTRGLALELGVEESRCHVHGLGADPDWFSPGDAGELRRAHGLLGVVFLSVARLVARKGVDVTLRAFAALREHFPEAHLVVLGDGPERTRLETLARELDLDTRALFLGSVDDAELRSWYRTADVFVLPARSEPPDVEGFGIVYLEAGSCGLPVIGPREGGPSDAIVDGETGLLVDPRSVPELTQAMLRLARDTSLRERLGRQARARVVNDANWDRVAAGLWQALHQASAKPPT